MFTNLLRTALAACLVGLLLCASGCGSNTYGGAGYGPESGMLYGVWFGSWSDTGDAANLVRLELTVDGYAGISSVRVDGAVQLDPGTSNPTTGALTLVGGQTKIYGFELTNGWRGGFYVDDSSGHAAIFDGVGLGVLQKGASSLPTYADADVLGASFDGYTLRVDDNLELLGAVSSYVDVLADGQFSGSIAIGVDFANVLRATPTTVNLESAEFGVWSASYEAVDNMGSSQGSAFGFLSPDKQFCAIGALADSAVGSSSPNDYRLSVWVRM